MNFSPDKFSWTIIDVPGGVRIHLTRLETSEVKSFFLAGGSIETRGEHLSRHMNSLTDDLMMQWFQQRDRKPKKEKKE